MNTDRKIREAIERCVSILVFHHNAERADGADAALLEDIRGMVHDPSLGGLIGGDLDALVLRPVRGEMIARYGHEVGPRLCSLLVARLDEAIDDALARDRAARNAPARPPARRGAAARA